ncbi:MAG: outer membrane lipoprotein carrier protein LolA, partial [Desulfobacteraceae bacterium]|nr:outer membrane lipoprotein carrier protein LolA [Desulfobacteraceae bacterium]
EPGRRIVLTPKEQAMAKVIQRIELNLAQQPGVIDSVKIFESDTAYTQMTFSHTVLNAKISEEIFRKIP